MMMILIVIYIYGNIQHIDDDFSYEYVSLSSEQYGVEMDEKLNKARIHFENLRILDKKRKKIKQLGQNLKENPHRRNSDINDEAVNVAISICQIAPNG